MYGRGITELGRPAELYSYSYEYSSSRPGPAGRRRQYCTVLVLRYGTGTRLGASSEQVVRDVNPDFGFRVFDKPTSES